MNREELLELLKKDFYTLDHTEIKQIDQNCHLLDDCEIHNFYVGLQKQDTEWVMMIEMAAVENVTEEQKFGYNVLDRCTKSSENRLILFDMKSSGDPQSKFFKRYLQVQRNHDQILTKLMQSSLPNEPMLAGELYSLRQKFQTKEKEKIDSLMKGVYSL